MGNAPTKPMGHVPPAEWAAAGETPDAAQGGIRPCHIYSLCNVVPDTPVHTHRLCSFSEDDGAATAATATPTTPTTTPTPARRGGSAKKKQERARRARRERRRKKRAQQKKRLRRKMARRQLLSQAVHAANDAAQSATPLSLPFPLDECEALLRTSDDDSDTDSDDTGSATGSGSESESYDERSHDSERGGGGGTAGKRRARRREKREAAGVPTDDIITRPSSGRAALPDMLDRRFDLDVAPSLESVDPRYNAAIATAMVLYNHLFLRFGVRYMVSPRDLFEKAIAAFYRSSLGDAHAYAHALTAKIDLSTMLRVLRTDASLRCEFECPSHVGSAAEEYEALRLAAVGDDRRDLLLGEQRAPPPDARPLYTMEYAYVEGDEGTMKRALLEEHCVVCNLSIFTNIFGAAAAGATTGVGEHEQRDGRGPDLGGPSGGGPDLGEPTAVPIVPGAPCVLQPPSQRDQALGMIAIYVVGYQGRHWIARFPFGLHWGERGYGYIPFDYFQRYNRDRWVMRATSCDDPTEHLQRRLQEQVAPTLPSALPHAMALDRALGGADASSHRRRRPRRRKDTGGRRRREEEAEEEEELTASDEDGGRGARSQRGQGRGIMRRVV